MHNLHVKTRRFMQNMKWLELSLKSESQTQVTQQVTVLTVLKFIFCLMRKSEPSY